MGYLCSILHGLASSSIVKLSQFNLEAQKSFDVGSVQAVEDADTSVHMCLKKVKKMPEIPKFMLASSTQNKLFWLRKNTMRIKST